MTKFLSYLNGNGIIEMIKLLYYLVQRYVVKVMVVPYHLLVLYRFISISFARPVSCAGFQYLTLQFLLMFFTAIMQL